MFAGDYQVVDVLMLVGNIVPIALYFLALGLVNSHARPFLITARTDFVTLSCALMPILLWPVPTFVGSGMTWVLLVGLVLVVGLFVWILTNIGTGLVIYNIDESCCHRILNDAIRAAGFKGRWTKDTWRDDAGSIAIHFRKFALLRNVTLHIEADSPTIAKCFPPLAAELDRRLATVAQLPSTRGACLVLVGVALMILPMWMVGRHIHDIVEAMSSLLG